MKANIRLHVYEKAGSTKLFGELNLMAEQLSCRQECRLPALQGREAQGPAGSPPVELGFASMSLASQEPAVLVVQCLCGAGACLISWDEFLLQQAAPCIKGWFGSMKIC